MENDQALSDLTIVKRIAAGWFGKPPPPEGPSYTPTPEDREFPFQFTVFIGEDKQRAYEYQVYGADGKPLPAKGYDYRYEDGSQMSQAGSGTVKSGGTLFLRHDERVVIAKIPAGTAYHVEEKNYLVYSDPDFKEHLSDDDFGCNDPDTPGHDKALTTASGWAGTGYNTNGELREKTGESVAVFENQKVEEKYQITMSSLVVVDRILAHPTDVDYGKGFEVTVKIGDTADNVAYWYEVVHLEDTAAALGPDEYPYDYDYYDRNDPGVPNQQKPQPDTPPNPDHFFGNSLAPPAHDKTEGDGTASGLKPLPEIPEVLDPETLLNTRSAMGALTLPKLPESYAADPLPLHKPVEEERWSQKDGALGKLMLSSDPADNPKGNANTIVVDLHHASAVIIYGIPVGTPYMTWQKDYTFIDGYMIDSTNKDAGTIEPDLEVQGDPDTGDKKLLRTRADIYNYFVLPIMREITVNKEWEHEGNPPESWPASTTITVYDPNNPAVFDSRAYRSIEEWAASFELPKYDPITGELIDYQIKEDMPPDYIITDVEQTGDAFTITNTYAPGIVRPAVQKWVDGKPPEPGRFSFEIKALKPNAPLPEPTTISIAGEGTGFWGDIKFDPVNQDETRTYRYEIRELPGGTVGYTYDLTVYIMTVTAVEKGGKVTVSTQYETQEGIAAYAPLSFRNKYQQAELADLTVTKTVRGPGADRTKAFQFTVHIDGKAPITFTLKHGERKVIRDIPVGTHYTVTEGNYYAQGYTTDAVNSDGTVPKEGITASFTNSKDALPGVGYLTVRKEVAGSGGESDRLFRFVVKIGNKPSQVVFLKDGQEKTFGPYSAGTAYRVTEDDYTQLGYVTTSTGASGQIRTRESVAVFTNTRQADNRGWLSVAKTVIGEGGDPEQKFDFVVTIDGKTHTLALADGETHVFTDLPVGAAYRVEEENYAAQGYITFSDGSAGTLLAGGNQATFTNQKGEIPPDAVGKLTVTKTVAGRFMDLTKRFHFTILVGDQVHTVALRHGEHAVLENIPLGTSYSVREENYSAEGYVTRSTGATGTISAEGATAAFVNAYHNDAPPQPGQDAVQVSGQKTWIHGTNKPAKYPRSITVYVMNGSAIVARKTVTEADGWRYAFNLPKYDEQGAEIVYSVSEETVKSYVKSISGYDILNTYTVGSPQTGDSNRMWVWLLLLAVGAAGLRSAVFYRKKGSR